eukprot:8946204-Pyramimonas_sp.AAC.1
MSRRLSTTRPGLGLHTDQLDEGRGHILSMWTNRTLPEHHQPGVQVGADHGVGLARPGGSVGEHGRIHPLQHALFRCGPIR